jgi:cysteine-rich repeat protein
LGYQRDQHADHQRRRRGAGGSVTFALTVAALAGQLLTPTGATAAKTDEERCRAAVVLTARRATTLAIVARTRCVRQRMNGRIPASVDCMADPSQLGGNGTGDEKTDALLAKLVKHRDRNDRRVEAACQGVALAPLGVADVCTPAVSTPDGLSECAVFDLGKPAGDSLAALLNVPAAPPRPGSNLRKCFVVVDRAVRFNARVLTETAHDCFTLADQVAVSNAGCLATVAPPGIVNTTGFAEIDDALWKRVTRFRNQIHDFCAGIDLAKLGFDAVLTDPTVPPLTVDDLYAELFDAVLSSVTALNAALFPSVPFCGNGTVDVGEQCDDGDRDSCDGCERDCSLPGCGNGAACGAELCDDGNTAGGDGCDGQCISEVCGNGVAQPGEECDDGNGNSDVLPDACRTDCVLPSCGDHVVDTGEACEPPGVGDCEPDCTSPNCGDGIVDLGEQCDDGASNSNTVPNACRTNCSLPSCGDGVVDGGEQCDPPDGGVTCKSDCRFVTCGNGVADAGEECDDGSGNSDVAPNACRTNCLDAHCGDSVVDSGEACDAGGASVGCDADCTPVQCGDGVRNAAAGEQCDDGGLVSGDGCDANCTTTRCGNGIATAPELCDDGNTAGGDGCSATCTCGPGSGEVGPCGTQDASCPNKTELVLLAGTTGAACVNNGDCEIGTCSTGLGRCLTKSELDTGWTGIAHDADIVDNVTTLANILCPGPAPTCGECGVIGIDPAPGNCRCANDNRKICDQPFAVDANDCGGDICNCYFGVPLPLSSGNTPACVVNRFRQNVTGTVNVDTGEGETAVRLASVVFLGISVLEPCPSCGGKCTAPAANVGLPCAVDLDCDSSLGDGSGACGNYDPIPEDGVRQGTCRSGQNHGQTCDAGPRHESFPAPGGGAHSLDCFPDTGKNVSGTGLKIDLDQGTSTKTLSVGITCGYPPIVVEQCHCGNCSGSATTPCHLDSECAAIGAGTCVRVGNNDPLPNQCAGDGICNAAGGAEGSCNQGPSDKFCDGILHANGEGFLACSSQDDCSVFPNDIAGDCTLTKVRECFLDTIVATGSADPEYPLGAATFCIGKTGNAGINAVAGLPGPGRVVNQGIVKHFCASNGAVQYQPGVGGCP